MDDKLSISFFLRERLPSEVDMIRIMMVCLLVISFVTSSCKKQGSKLASQSIEQDIELDTEFEDINLQGPVGNLVSISWNVPVFDSGKSLGKKTELNLLTGFKTPSPIETAVNVIKSDAKLQGILNAEYAGQLSVNMFGEVCEKLPCKKESDSQKTASGDMFMRRFYGYCLNDKVYALQAYSTAPGKDQDVLQEDFDGALVLRLLDKMPPSYRTDIVGCRARFEELVKVKFANTQQQINMSSQIETLNFAFSFLPGYSGVENYTKGNVVLGVSEVAADIASLGLATKFKAGWKSLMMSERMFENVQNGAIAVNVVANTFRLGSIVQQVRERGVSITDVPSVVLLVAETGFVIAKIKVRPGKIPTGSSTVVQNIVSTLQESLAKLGKRVVTVEPGSIQNLFKAKFQGVVSAEELINIRKTINSGQLDSLEDLHKLMSNTNLKVPDTVVNVTSEKTLFQILDSNGTYWGYIGFPGLPKGLYSTPKPISWSTWDLISTQGAAVQRDVMLVFVGDAATQFKKVKLESGFVGRSIAMEKTILKPFNPEFATIKTGDVRFTDYKVYNDGSKSLVLVNRIEILDELQGVKINSPEYQKLTRVKAAPFCLAVLTDASTAVIAAGGTLVGAMIATKVVPEAVEWLMSSEQ